MQNQENMNRNEFLKSLGLKGASLLAVYCASLAVAASSCSSSDSNTPTPSTGTTIDLTSTEGSALNAVGGWIVKNGIVIAQTATGSFVAVTQTCSHENLKKVTYQASSKRFYCTEHGALYDLTGKGLNTEGAKGIKLYTVSKSGNVLTIS